MRVVTVRRWEITVAFVAVTVAFVIQGVILAHHGAQTHALAVKTHGLVVKQRQLTLARVRERKRTDARICRKVDRLDQALLAVVGSPTPAPRPGWYGYDYWVSHPQEKVGRPGSSSAAQMRAARGTLKQLRAAACDPHNLTKGQGP